MRKDEMNSKELLKQQIEIAMSKSRELEDIIADIKKRVSDDEKKCETKPVKEVKPLETAAKTSLITNPTFITMFALLKSFGMLVESVKEYTKELEETEIK